MAILAHFSLFRINTQALYFFIIFFAKWPPVAILDDRKSFSIAFLSISDQYATFYFNYVHKMAAGGHFGWPKITFDRISWHFRSIYNFCFQNGRRRPFWKSDFRQTTGFFHYALSMAMPNMKLIGEFMTQLDTPQAYWAFLYKMVARGHFVFPIEAKSQRVLLIWDLNGYDEYEFDWCICDKVMACTSVGVGGATKNIIIPPKCSNFRDIITFITNTNYYSRVCIYCLLVHWQNWRYALYIWTRCIVCVEFYTVQDYHVHNTVLSTVLSTQYIKYVCSMIIAHEYLLMIHII